MIRKEWYIYIFRCGYKPTNITAGGAPSCVHLQRWWDRCKKIIQFYDPFQRVGSHVILPEGNIWHGEKLGVPRRPPLFLVKKTMIRFVPISLQQSRALAARLKYPTKMEWFSKMERCCQKKSSISQFCIALHNLRSQNSQSMLAGLERFCSSKVQCLCAKISLNACWFWTASASRFGSIDTPKANCGSLWWGTGHWKWTAT